MVNVSAGEHQLCQQGLLSLARDTCCASSCAKCGGAQCKKDKGGAQSCCARDIKRRGRMCERPVDTSCVMPAGLRSSMRDTSRGAAASAVGQLPRPEGRPAGLEIRSAAEARSLPWVHVAAGIVVKLHSIYGLWAPALQLRREAMPVDPLSQLPPLPQTRVRSTMGKLVAAGAVVTHTVHGRSSIDRAIRSYLESSQRPEWWALYADATVPHVARSDLGRYALLYEEGGLYMDIDAELLTEGAAAVLNASYMGQAIVWTEKMVEISELGRHEHPHKQRLAQYALFAPPRHQLLDSVLRESFLRLSKLLHPHPKLSRKKAVSDGDVLWATGPDAVTSVVWEQNIRRMLVPSRPLSARMVAHEERGS